MRLFGDFSLLPGLTGVAREPPLNSDDGSPIILMMNASCFFRKPAFFFLGRIKIDVIAMQWPCSVCQRHILRLVCETLNCSLGSWHLPTQRCSLSALSRQPGIPQHGEGGAIVHVVIFSLTMPCLRTACHDLCDEQDDRGGKLLHLRLVNGLIPGGWASESFGVLQVSSGCFDQGGFTPLRCSRHRQRQPRAIMC